MSSDVVVQDEFARLIIHRGPVWTVQLHPDQRYLGRLVIFLNRVAEIDFLDLTEAEVLSYYSTARSAREALTRTFKPDMFNHATLRNEWRQHHWHLVPRYEGPRTFNDMTFIDPRWGKNWAPYDKLDLKDEQLLTIRDAIKAEFKPD